jgi:putative membrane protein
MVSEGSEAMMFYGHGMAMGGTLLVFLVALPALLVAVWLILAQSHRPSDAPARPDSVPPDPIPDAERTLADRFARGEIATQEYEERLRALRAARR